MSDEVKNYTKYEFCIAVHCPRLGKMNDGNLKCMVSGNHRCIKTAKQLHRWLNDNGFHILKRIDLNG